MLRSVALPAARTALRRSSPTAAASTTSVTSVPVYKRTLVSTVLLSRDAYDERKISELKSELKKRGLNTNGKRNDLVDRLMDNDKSSPKFLSGSNSKQQQSTRSASTKSKRGEVKPEVSHHSVGTPDKATIPHPSDIQPGQVSSNAADVAGGIVIPNEVLETQSPAPGVPPEKMARVPIVFEVKIPYEKIPVDAGPEIPLMTGYFHPENPMYKGERSPDEGPVAHLPKVIATSGEDTKVDGRVSHHVADFEHHDAPESSAKSNSSAVDEQTISLAINSFFGSLSKDLGFEVKPEVQKKAVNEATSTLETTKTLLKEARDTLAPPRAGPSSSGSGSSSASYSTASSYSGGSTRPLNDDEVRGLYVLFGIVGGGFLLGGLAKPSKKKIEKVKKEIEGKAKEAKKEAHVLPVSDAELASLVAKAERILGNHPEARLSGNLK